MSILSLTFPAQCLHTRVLPRMTHLVTACPFFSISSPAWPYSKTSHKLTRTQPHQTDLGISPTAYGTRWYLTLFNYSIPFPAQLRVWDVFMLLGDADPSISPSPSSQINNNIDTFAGSLDVLHATSAALIDGTREILLDSDFENAMKVLTSWIPIKDEELLMRVARAEWRGRRRRR